MINCDTWYMKEELKESLVYKVFIVPFHKQEKQCFFFFLYCPSTFCKLVLVTSSAHFTLLNALYYTPNCFNSFNWNALEHL